MEIMGLDHGSFKINIKNMNAFGVRKEKDWLELDFIYKEKIKTDKITLPKKFKNFLEIDAFINKYGFVRMGNYYINVRNACIIEKEILPDTITHLMINVYFNIGETFRIKMTKNDFSALEAHKLVF